MGSRDLSCLLPARGSGRISISRLVLPGKHRPCSRGFRRSGRSDGWVSRALPQNENPHAVVHAHFAHWAHVGGFIFGALAALVIGRTGLEHKANAAIEEKISWTADPAIVQGTELMEQGKLDEAITILQKHAAAKPEAMDAYS